MSSAAIYARRRVVNVLAIFISGMPGIAAMIRSALEKAGTSFSLK